MLCIDRVLRRKGMTQGDLARMLGVSVQAVNSVVCGRTIPSQRLMERYAGALGVAVDDLYDGFLCGP